MRIDESLRVQLIAAAKSLDKLAASSAFPPSRTLSERLNKLIPKDSSVHRNIDQTCASNFVTAAVDIWLRGVHSFLVSASLSEASPIWASVSGYYSSHYAVRGIAHLLGYFQLFHNKRIVEFRLNNGKYVCSFMQKTARDGEHKLYWKLVKQSALFKEDGIFTENNFDDEESDIKHRNHANYADHLSGYPVFRPLDKTTVRDRIEFISKIVFDAPPLPRFSKFPDVENVQLIAYHRLVRFRTMVDEVFGAKNRFWNVYRNPSFAAGLIDFQIVEGMGIAHLGEM